MGRNLEIGAAFLGLESAARGHVQVSALEGGRFTLPKTLFVSGAPDDEKALVPSLSFLVVYEHDKTGSKKRALFDLGLRREPNAYAPRIQCHLAHRKPMYHLPDARQSLLAGGLEPGSIDEVILSHVHWDHIGTPSDYSHSRFFVGSGSLALTKSGLNGHMSHSNFQADLFDGLAVEEFPDVAVKPTAPTSSRYAWRDFGGLRILDFSTKGTVYVVDTPGHLTGHISLLCRIGERRWVLLVGDACHDLRLLTGEASIAEWLDSEGRTCCIHMDKEKASQTLKTFRKWKEASVHVGMDLQIVFAHDAEWAAQNPRAFLPGAM